ncbi:ADP-glyceromanno-heptose 6-epimerase [Cupriavidus sp. WKF15]|uniref:ADP-glyceromanno-heptose 6-epimerase n=1 Tax=Cupriavidus sp. WKF15 TaxID=3032282 RepID=UPI0023E1FD17|nr:ADP-glyceromanno-heptose 6-epimerase [Cupriavidus sp. WKF15]WER46781.1 ADP-glyceromanno-heptose 6-epimerase [Cupriavidus sp. WKF15]
MTIIVTGAAGFIGSNLVKGLNARGEDQVVAVDNLQRPDKFHNLVDCEIRDYLDKDDFLSRFERGEFGRVRAVFHLGACTDTMEQDGRYLMANNYRYSKVLMESCLAQDSQFIYASSAAVYGESQAFREARECERPLSIYGYSKFLFDQVVRERLEGALSQVVGLRYFNVYGPGEAHKNRMASIIWQQFEQFRAEGTVKLFGEHAGHGAGCQSHDFVAIEDVVRINLFFLDHPRRSGIFNVGTGQARSFNDVACVVVNTLREAEGKPPLAIDELVQEGLLEYIRFPDALRGRYQSFTQSDLSRLRAAGYATPFVSMEEGVARYCQWLLDRCR